MSTHFPRCILFPMLVFFLQGSAQTTKEQKKAADLEQLSKRIESRQYLFNAQSATTQRGKTITLTSTYYLQVNEDSLSVNLPYYGRATSASYPSSNPALYFNSTNFDYKGDTAKKGGWTVIISPKNNSDVTKINLDISLGGYCTVRVFSNSRDMISFYGAIAGIGNY